MAFNKINSGTKKSFQVTIGLREGYEENAVIYHVDEVVNLTVEYLKECAKAGEGFLRGMVIPGEVCYAYKDGRGLHEPVALYMGEVSPIYNENMSDDEAVEFLVKFSEHLAEKLHQKRMYITFKDEIMVFEKSEQDCRKP